MTTTYKGALDEIFSAFNIAWNAQTTAIVGYVPKVEWPGIDSGVIPDTSKFWVRISNQTVINEQSTLSESVVQNGSRRFESFGLVFLQIFAPKRKNAIDDAKDLAMIAQNIFRQRTANVIMRNSRIQELPSENGAIRMNVVAEYEFDEIF